MCKQAYRVARPMEAQVYVFVEYIIPHNDDNSYGIGLCICTLLCYYFRLHPY